MESKQPPRPITGAPARMPRGSGLTPAPAPAPKPDPEEETTTQPGAGEPPSSEPAPTDPSEPSPAPGPEQPPAEGGETSAPPSDPPSEPDPDPADPTLPEEPDKPSTKPPSLGPSEPPGEPSIGPGDPTLPGDRPLMICFYWNPAATSGLPWTVNRDSFKGVWKTSGNGWMQHVREVQLPEMRRWRDAGWQVFSDWRNPLGRGDGTVGQEFSEHMNALQLFDAPGFMLSGFQEAMELVTAEFPGRLHIYMGNLTGVHRQDQISPSDALFSDVGPERWCDQVLYAWRHIIAAKAHIAVDTLYARNRPDDEMMSALLPRLLPLLAEYDGKLFGEPFDEDGSWRSINDSPDRQQRFGTYVHANYWSRMNHYQRETWSYHPVVVGEFGTTDGTKESWVDYIAERYSEGVWPNMPGYKAADFDPAEIAQLVRAKL